MYITRRYGDSSIKISWRNSNVVISGKWRRVELQWQRNDDFKTSFEKLCLCVYARAHAYMHAQSCLTQFHGL